MKVAVIGLGLIGGSIALSVQKNNFASEVIGVDANNEHSRKAIEMGMIHRALELPEAIRESDLIILATPVDVSTMIISDVLALADNKIVMDVGSTKFAISEKADECANRSRFVATHPMWGTEFSGPMAAKTLPFTNNAVVICDREKSAPTALATVERLYESFGMRLIYMDAASHDVHAAYVSHISHITSFALANTVLKKEKKEAAIFSMASGGFESTVRLAKSNAAMWCPIFLQNKNNVLDVLQEHIDQLTDFKTCIENDDQQGLYQLIVNANTIKRILK